jgi:hypothetical protein
MTRKGWHLCGCNTAYFCRSSPMFQRNVLPTSSGYKNMPTLSLAWPSLWPRRQRPKLQLRRLWTSTELQGVTPQKINLEFKVQCENNVIILVYISLWNGDNHSGHVIYGMNSFAGSNTGLVGLNTARSMNVSLCLFRLFPWVQAAILQWANPPSKESYWLCTGSRYWKGGQGPIEDCRAITTNKESVKRKHVPWMFIPY